MKISREEALCHLILSRKEDSFNRYNKNFNQLFKKNDFEKLKKIHDLMIDKNKLPSDRFKQCFEEKNELFLEKILISKIYNKYFAKALSLDKWKKDFIVNFAKNHFEDEDIKRIGADKIKPPIFSIMLINTDKYNILDGIHRTIAFIRNNKNDILSVVCKVKEDIE